ncbi:hypothetical protein C1Y63_01330 [Corynebacterium sp. 13CS0277]|nr:hypothetical protein C1Y63_01330 [Corynebacterium sp. 13CS0277]
MRKWYSSILAAALVMTSAGVAAAAMPEDDKIAVGKDDSLFADNGLPKYPNPDSKDLLSVAFVKNDDGQDVVRFTAPEIAPGTWVSVRNFVGFYDVKYKKCFSGGFDGTSRLTGGGSSWAQFRQIGDDHTVDFSLSQVAFGLGPMIVALDVMPEDQVNKVRNSPGFGVSFFDTVAWTWVTSKPGPDAKKPWIGATVDNGYDPAAFAEPADPDNSRLPDCLLPESYDFSDDVPLSPPRKKPAAEPSVPAAPSTSATPSTPAAPSVVPSTAESSSSAAPTTPPAVVPSTQVEVPKEPVKKDPAKGSSDASALNITSVGGAVIALLLALSGLGALVSMLAAAGLIPKL